MTGRTHDLAAFTGLMTIFVTQPLMSMSIATLVTALAANFIGGLAPDLDQPTAELWTRIRGGSIIGKLLAPIMGGHRMISHSLIGLAIWAFCSKWVLTQLGTLLLVDMNIVWYAFMIGIVTHFLTDLLTRDGLPLLFPLPFMVGFPPFKSWRMKTGSWIEKSIVFPGLILINAYLIYHNYFKLLDFLRLHLY
jgi:membrane-bound metal-dependent hydrolase YbcI (DUF457 family)